MKIVGYLRTSLLEWPGKISSVVFVPGCNFRCPFCHNSDLVDPARFKRLEEYSEQSILQDLKKRKKWIDGVVITGGEPTLQLDLPQFLEKIKALGFPTMVETNGSQPEIISKLSSCQKLANGRIVDFLTVDFKVPFEQYNLVCSENDIAKKVRASIEIILKSKIDFEIRTTIVPGIHNEKTLVKMAKQLLKICQKLSRKPPVWFLQSFQPKNCLDSRFEKVRPFNKIEMEMFLKTVRKIIPTAKPRGE